MRLCLALACACCWLALCATPVCAADMHPGFRTLGIWSPETQTRLDISVWYPSIRRPSEHVYTPWKITASRNGKPCEGRYPLILLSHDTGGTRFSHHDTAAWLARLGFVVVAPTHSNDNMDNMRDLFTLNQLVRRARELKVALDTVLHDEQTNEYIDAARMGALGFGMGGTTVLLLGGALLSPDNWPNYCETAHPHDAYCSVWAKSRMDALVRQLPLRRSLADVRVKAICAVAPACGMLFTRESLRYLYPLTAIIRAELPPRQPIDADQPPAPTRHPELTAGWHADRVREWMPTVPHFYHIPVDAPSLASCPTPVKAYIHDYCGKADAKARQAAHKQLNAKTADFFLRVLGGAEPLPVIPAPPDLTPPPPPPAPALSTPPAKGQPRRNRR